ncbi:MAG: EAL domain-containing protein [Deltaproteobacteria bacterium]|nr:EAL domain-containing protein [Deltaproteobacteria bacterium]
MRKKQPKTQNLVSVTIDEDFYFNRNLGIATLLKEYPKIEKIFVESLHMACLSIQIDQLRKIEYTYGTNTYNDLLVAIAGTIKELKEKKFRKDDRLILDFFESETFVIFLSGPRKSSTRLLEHLERISERIWLDIREALFHLFYPYLKENAKPKIGYALIVKNPMIKNVRLITRLVRDCVNMGNFMSLKKAYTGKYMLQRLIIDEDISTVFQPIVDLNTLEIIGYEALARGPKGTEYSSPLLLFILAAEHGLSFELDRLCRKKAFESVRNLKKKNKIFVNTLTMTIHDPEFRGMYLNELLEDLKIKPENVIFEISETWAIDNYALFRKALKDYTDIGIVCASDDTGKGYSDLERIIELKPGFLKVDISLVRDIDKSYIKQEIMRAIINLGKSINSEIVAEGIETRAEYEQLKAMDVEYGQGYLFAKPSAKMGRICKKF